MPKSPRVVVASVAAIATVLAVLSGALADDPSPLRRLSIQEAPPSLAGTGLYSDFARHKVAKANRPYDPQYPLWSDGAKKQRWISLPRGSKIMTDDMNAWEFPIGTRIWKEFVLGDRRVETRYLEKGPDAQWIVATYIWNAAQTRAMRAPEDGMDNVVPLRPGLGYRVPGTFECLSCHTGGRDALLGFSALQLSTARDRVSANAKALTLKRLANEGLLTNPPTRQPRIPSSSRVERDAIGYLSSNCASCHRPGGLAEFSGLHLEVNVNETFVSRLKAYTTGVGQISNFIIPGHERTTKRIRAGSPTDSSVLYRMESESVGELMPQLGRVTRDEAAIANMREWITQLPPARRR